MRVLTPLLLAVAVTSCKPRHQGSQLKDDASPPDAPVTPVPAVEGDGSFDPETAKQIGTLFQQVVDQRSPPGAVNVKRAVFLKPHGCAKATFTVASDLPERLRVGVFAAPATHDAWVRISSDTIPKTPDQSNNTIGFAVKVLNVPGPKVLPGEEEFSTQDFVTQNHHVFFADTAKDFLEFTNAAFAGQLQTYFAAHPVTDKILKDMAKPTGNILDSRYWSTTPYHFGDHDFAKYKFEPCGPVASEPAPAATAKNYLRDRLVRDLGHDGACFNLKVQLRTGDDMPLDKATVEWSETVSPPVTVATVKIAPQNIVPLDGTCENMSFTAWHALEDHRPAGSINKARGLIYKRLADLRRGRNSVQIAEPE